MATGFPAGMGMPGVQAVGVGPGGLASASSVQSQGGAPSLDGDSQGVYRRRVMFLLLVIMYLYCIVNDNLKNFYYQIKANVPLLKYIYLTVLFLGIIIT